MTEGFRRNFDAELLAVVHGKRPQRATSSTGSTTPSPLTGSLYTLVVSRQPQLLEAIIALGGSIEPSGADWLIEAHSVAGQQRILDLFRLHGVHGNKRRRGGSFAPAGSGSTKPNRPAKHPAGRPSRRWLLTVRGIRGHEALVHRMGLRLSQYDPDQHYGYYAESATAQLRRHEAALTAAGLRPRIEQRHTKPKKSAGPGQYSRRRDPPPTRSK